MIIDKNKSIIYAKSFNKEFSSLQPHADAKKQAEALKILIINNSHKTGKAMSNRAKEEDAPILAFTKETPLLTVFKDSPTAFPTSGIKLEAANFTDLKERESALALITF